MIIKPKINDTNLTKKIFGYDENLKKTLINVIEEKPLTLYLNDQEIVTMMTINDFPKFLSIGYLLNQNMISNKTKIEAVDYEADLRVIVIRTKKKTNFEIKLRKKTITSGCAQGTLFGDVMENFDKIKLSKRTFIKKDWIYDLSKKLIIHQAFI